MVAPRSSSNASSLPNIIITRGDHSSITFKQIGRRKKKANDMLKNVANHIFK
jgi:hypothetical protein